MVAYGQITFSVLAQAKAPLLKGSYLQWFLDRLGPFYSLVIPLAGLLIFFGACFVVLRSRRPAMIAAWLVLVPVPLMIGLQAAVMRQLPSLLIIATSGVQPTAAEIAEELASSLVPLFLGSLETWPAFFVLAAGLIFRTYQAGKYRPATAP